MRCRWWCCRRRARPDPRPHRPRRLRPHPELPLQRSMAVAAPSWFNGCMSDSDQSPPAAWEPLTPYGVAAFARASLGRLLLVQLLVAIAAGGLTVWFLHHAWLPVVRA